MCFKMIYCRNVFDYFKLRRGVSEHWNWQDLINSGLEPNLNLKNDAKIQQQHVLLAEQKTHREGLKTAK